MAEFKTPSDDTSSHLAKDELALDVDVVDVEGQAAARRLEKRLLLKVDLRMSYLILLYIVNITHRPHFHVSNMFMNFIGKPSLYLPGCGVTWGIIAMLSGVTRKFVFKRSQTASLSLNSRPLALLDTFYVGFSSGLPKLVLCQELFSYYPSDELGVRVALLFCATYASNAFGALMAASILDSMEGALGLAAWRWLCLIEGAVTIGIAFIGFFVLPDFPNTSGRWLTTEEKALAIERMAQDDRAQPTSHMEGLKSALKDWKVWWLSVLMISVQLSLSFITFFPTLTATLGYSLKTTLLLCAPPWALTTVFAFFLTRHSDLTSERCWHSVVPVVIGIVGTVIAMSTMNTAARYVSLFLMSQSPVGPIVTTTWMMTSIHPASKRAVAIALTNALGQLGLVAGPYAWDQRWGPTYLNSFAICLAASSLSILMSFVFRWHLASLNAEAQKKEAESGQTEPGFRYVL
ncbi:hypothetical protein ONZ45_g5203 [Pleurotus djamor]|nr:hypothetical protein ONZ45_g5203 [Pleurotus djamor]